MPLRSPGKQVRNLCSAATVTMPAIGARMPGVDSCFRAASHGRRRVPVMSAAPPGAWAWPFFFGREPDGEKGENL